jgi:hypothetical protein
MDQETEGTLSERLLINPRKKPKRPRPSYKTESGEWRYRFWTLFWGGLLLTGILVFMLGQSMRAYTELQQKQGIGRSVTIIKGDR